MAMRLPIASIRTDGGTQPRGHINEGVVERYAEAMAAGLWDWSRSAAPIVVFYDGTDHWLADGFHRLAAAKTAGLTEVEADVIAGTLRDARWFSFSVNAEHGYARDREDVARILRAIFEDAEWRAVPVNEIARHTRIPETTVRRHHEKHLASSPVAKMEKPAVRTVTRGGKTYEMDTGAIGKAKPADGLVTMSEDEWRRLEKQAREEAASRKVMVLEPERPIPPEERRQWEADNLRRLIQVAPDLADRVKAGELTLGSAQRMLNDRDKEARSVRDSVFMGLADFCLNAAGFATGKIYRQIPEWLEVEECRAELRRYFKGGVPELIEKTKQLRPGVEAVERIIARLSGDGLLADQLDPRDAELSRLEAEVAALREQLHNRSAEPKASSADEAQAYLNRLAEAERLAKALGSPESRADALREHHRLRNVFAKFDRALRALERQVGAPGHNKKRAKIQALVDRGATPGERDAASEALARYSAPPPPSATDPEPLPRTREELLARRRAKGGAPANTGRHPA